PPRSRIDETALGWCASKACAIPSRPHRRPGTATRRWRVRSADDGNARRDRPRNGRNGLSWGSSCWRPTALLDDAGVTGPPGPPDASGLAGSPMPAVTPVRSSPTPPPSASPGAGSPTPTSPNVAPTAAFPAGHTLTFADNGAVVALRVGQHLDLLLPESGFGAWDRPIIDGT